ncbi:UPF0489 family protein [Pedobacter sp. AW31-3R]|uniref:UPF0489 family protein n=1 Tax=Pedobacter sp. AW31-3R TaxID=3445781 RepID=UPI003FA15303
MKIKTFILEEHNEAYMVWQYALKSDLIKKKNNTLIHIDEHSDMGVSQYKTSIYDSSLSFKAIRDFTYNEVSIGGFIVPAVLLGLFDKVFWIKQHHHKKRYGHFSMLARSYNAAGKKIKCSKTDAEAAAENIAEGSDLKRFDYYLHHAEDMIPAHDLLLDIDLDYFCCTGDPQKMKETYIEITKDEFDEFNVDKYHMLRYVMLDQQIETLQIQDKYYYVINNFKEVYPFAENVEEEIIQTRISSLIKNLKEKKIIPSIITICRSKISGYTPDNKCEFIQKNLLDQLQALYDLDIVAIEELI